MASQIGLFYGLWNMGCYYSQSIVSKITEQIKNNSSLLNIFRILQFEKATFFIFFCKKAKVPYNLQPDKNLERHCFPEDNLALLELLCFLSFQHMRAADNCLSRKQQSSMDIPARYAPAAQNA